MGRISKINAFKVKINGFKKIGENEWEGLKSPRLLLKINLAGGFRTFSSFHWIWTRWHFGRSIRIGWFFRKDSWIFIGFSRIQKKEVDWYWIFSRTFKGWFGC